MPINAPISSKPSIEKTSVQVAFLLSARSSVFFLVFYFALLWAIFWIFLLMILKARWYFQDLIFGLGVVSAVPDIENEAAALFEKAKLCIQNK